MAYLRGERDGFDSFDPPASGGREAADATSTTANAEGELGREPQFEAMVLTVDADFDVKPHQHDGQVNAFFVLQGEVEFAVGGDHTRAGRGSWMSAPPGAVHGLRNAGAEPAKVLFVRRLPRQNARRNEPGKRRIVPGMTTTDTNAEISVRLDFDSLAATFSAAMNRLDGAAKRSSIGSVRSAPPRAGPRPRVAAQRLRVLHRHAHQGHACDRRTEQRSTRCPRGATPSFSPRERAALAFTESVTLARTRSRPDRGVRRSLPRVHRRRDRSADRPDRHDQRWNAIGVSTRAWMPGSYQR